MGAQTSHGRDEEGESADKRGLFGDGSPPLYGDFGQHRYDGQIGGVFSHSRNQRAVETVAEKGRAWAHQGKSPRDQDKTDGPRLFRRQGPNLYQLRTQGGHCQREVHPGGPGHLLDGPEEEEARNGGGRVVPSLG